MVQQQICPSCSTANSTFAITCRSCSSTLLPAPPRRTDLADPQAGGPMTFHASELRSSSVLASDPDVHALDFATAEPTPVRAPAATWSSQPGDLSVFDTGAPPASLSAIAAAPLFDAGWPTTDPDAAEERGAGIPQTHAGGAPERPGPAASGFHLDHWQSAPSEPAESRQWGAILAAPPATGPPPNAAMPASPAAGFGIEGSPAPASAPAPPMENGHSLGAPAIDPLFALHSPGAAFSPSSEAIPAHRAPVLEPGESGNEDQGRGWGIRETRRPASTWTPEPSGPLGPTPGYPQWHQSMAVAGAAPWQAPPRSGPGAVLGRLALMLVPILAIAGGLLFLRFHGSGSGTHTISMPSSIGGVLQNTDSQFTALADQLKASASKAPGINQAEIGFYGQRAGGLPEFEVAMASAQHGLGQADIDEFVRGFNSASGANFSRSTTTTTTDQGVDFICGPFSLQGQSGNVCVWVDGNVLGAVVGFPGVDAAGTLAEAQAARATAEH